MEVLRQGPVGVAEVQAQVDPDVANISQHLAVLRNAGIVTTRRSGPTGLYNVCDAEVFTVLDALREIFSHRLDSMHTMLALDEGGRSAPRYQRRRIQRETPPSGLGESVRP
jgi:ArsR family transcriptional regulator